MAAAMPTMTLLRSGLAMTGLIALCAGAAGCAPAAESGGMPAAPILLRWPDPAFLPERQCRGAYATEDLERFLPRAELALSIPGTRMVVLDPARRCITITVESVGGGRLAELIMRGVALPRAAVLLKLTAPERSI